jgi:hypothetical protein
VPKREFYFQCGILIPEVVKCISQGVNPTLEWGNYMTLRKLITQGENVFPNENVFTKEILFCPRKIYSPSRIGEIFHQFM